jgi:hypothetical protein
MDLYVKKPVVVKSLFDKETYSTILRFMEEWLPLLPLSSDRLAPEDGKFGRRFGHNVAFFRDIHHQLTDFACEIFQEKVKPSYSFLSLYDFGGKCDLHLDRPQCRYTVDYLIQQETEEIWPICISDQMTDKELADSVDEVAKKEDKEEFLKTKNWTECSLLPNDAVCYSGTHSWHYRPSRSNGTVDLVFWHFVPEGFSGLLD